MKPLSNRHGPTGMHIASLHIYPVKAMRAQDIRRAKVGPLGFEGDRRWLVADATGKFLTQRTHPKLATIKAELVPAGLALSAPGMPTISIDTPDGARRAEIIVWKSKVSAAPAGGEADEWLSRYVGEDSRLAYMDRRAERLKVAPEWIAEPVPVSFADAYPVLVATTGSLAALNAEIARAGGVPVTLRRFRPNLVIQCDDPWQEDFWARIRVGGAELDLVKPSDRCIVTTTDQESGQRMGKEPLASLARLRRSADARINGVLFAWNAVPRVFGEVAVGDRVEVLERRPEGFPLRSASSARSDADALVGTLVDTGYYKGMV